MRIHKVANKLFIIQCMALLIIPAKERAKRSVWLQCTYRLEIDQSQYLKSVSHITNNVTVLKDQYNLNKYITWSFSRQKSPQPEHNSSFIIPDDLWNKNNM